MLRAEYYWAQNIFIHSYIVKSSIYKTYKHPQTHTPPRQTQAENWSRNGTRMTSARYSSGWFMKRNRGMLKSVRAKCDCVRLNIETTTRWWRKWFVYGNVRSNFTRRWRHSPFLATTSYSIFLLVTSLYVNQMAAYITNKDRVGCIIMWGCAVLTLYFSP